MISDAEVDRAAFEKWAVAKNYVIDRMRDDPDTYWAFPTQDKWIGWNACLNHRDDRYRPMGWREENGQTIYTLESEVSGPVEFIKYDTLNLAGVVGGDASFDERHLEWLVPLARRALHIAYVWNDHNFDSCLSMARATAKEVGINNFEEANEALDALAKGNDHGN